MSAGIRASLLAIPLAVFALWGAFHVPAPDSLNRLLDAHEDISLDALPALPRWADATLPDFSQYEVTADKKKAFFSYLYPRIVLANSRILIQRQYLETLERKESLDEQEIAWLEKQSERLRVDEEPGTDEMFRKLRSRLDVIPPSLVMAQAANESAWGTSRFARKGNNLFGQWCFSKGCGIVPSSRGAGKSHEVAVFPSPYRSVTSYIQNLNRHPTYQLLRDIRREKRDQGRFASGSALAAGLVGYSERGEEYISELRSMISYNKLARYDTEFRNTVFENGTRELAQLASSNQESALLPGKKREQNIGNEG